MGVVRRQGENRVLEEIQSRAEEKGGVQGWKGGSAIQTNAGQGGALGGSGIWLLISRRHPKAWLFISINNFTRQAF